MATGLKKDSLRERKKAKTRLELLTVAARLFRQQGYEETTLEQIADEAEVSIRTLPRYFESKLQLALAGLYENSARFRRGMLDPERELDAVAYWRSHVEASVRALDVRAFASHAKFTHTVPALRAGVREVYRELEDSLAIGIAMDADVDPDTDLYGQLLAAMLVGGHFGALRRWFVGGRKQDMGEAVLAVIDFAIESFPARTSRGAKRLALV